MRFFFFCLLLFINQFIWSTGDVLLISPLLEQKNKSRVQWVPRTENPFRGDGKVWLGQNPSPFSRNPSGSQPSSSGMLSPTSEGWGLSYPGCFSPGSREGFPLHPLLSLFQPHWSNYNTACKLQHHKTWYWNYLKIGSVNRWSGALKKRTVWSVKVQWQILCLGTMGIL